MDGDYDGDWIVAVYPTKELADAHGAGIPGHSVHEWDVRGDLHPDVNDPDKQRQRAEEAERWQEQGRRYNEHQEEQNRLAANCRPRKGHMSLCKCPVWNSDASRWVNDYGYCRYCGGFTIAVFREIEGEAALQAKIDEFDLRDRERLRRLAAAELTSAC